VIGITVPTLEKHYRAELDRGAARVEAELVQNLMRIARGNGNAAFKAIAFCLQTRFGWSRYAPPPHREPILGKKETLDRDAQSVPSDWAEPIRPTRAN
jgi:hypothetical protein